MSVNNVAFPGRLVVKASLALPATATATLFTLSGGSVLVTGLLGLVTTATGSTATNLSLGTTASGTSIGTATAIASKAAGSWIIPSSTSGVGGALTVVTGGALFLPVAAYAVAPFVLATGNNISWTTSATDTGNISWYLWYIPIDADSGLS